MDAETLLRAEIEALRNEVKAAKRQTSWSLLAGALAIIVSAVALSTSYNKNQNPKFQNLTAKSIKILDEDSSPAEVINSDGIEFLADHPTIQFKPSRTDTFIIDQDGLYSFDNKGSELLLGITGMILSSKFGSGPETHFNNGHIFLQTSSNYTVDIGTQDTLAGRTAGIKIYNSAFNSPNGGAEISLTPQDIELDDSSGNERASIGQTNLSNSTTGSNQTTGLSSVVLFDTSGHVIWQQP
jgi:hypothetical protein